MTSTQISDFPGGQAASRVLKVLTAVATSPTPISVSEVAERCSLNRTTAWRMLQVLELHGFVDRDEHSGRYQLGASTLFLAPPGKGDDALVRRSLSALSRLAREVEETVNLSVGRAGHAIAVHQIDPPGTLAVDWVGRVFPPHLTSDGKVYLAYLDEVDLNRYLKEGTDHYPLLDPFDEHALRQELAEVRQRNIAYTLGELDRGLNGISAGSTAPGGELLAIVSITGPAHRTPKQRLDEMVPPLTRVAGDISAALAL